MRWRPGESSLRWLHWRSDISTIVRIYQRGPNNDHPELAFTRRFVFSRPGSPATWRRSCTVSALSLQGRTYVVTGSASGIGAATAALIRSRGGHAIGCDIENADLEVDLSTPDGRASLVEQVKARGPIDAVLAIAGGARRGVIETNYFGAVATLTGLRPLLAASESPRA